MSEAHEALARIASEYGVKPMSLAQWVENAGSYGKRNAHETPHRRRLPPRGSPDGEALAVRIRSETGTAQVRTLAAQIVRGGA